MKHGVILMSYNRPRLIVEAMRSVLDQDADVLLYVTDDGSNEETLAVIRETADERATLLLLDTPLPEHRRNGGERSCARIHYAVGYIDPSVEVVHYLPDDDVFMDGRFAAFDRGFEALPAVPWFYGRIVPLSASGERLPDRHFCFDPFPGVPIKEPDCRVDVTQVGHRRECLEQATWELPVNHEGHFFTKMAEDFGPICPLLTDKPVAGHRYHEYNLLTVQDRAGELPRETPCG